MARETASWNRAAALLTGPVVLTGAVVLTATLGAQRVAAQSPLDIFSTHSGSSRSPSFKPQEWFSVTSLLLTEFDGRFADSSKTYPRDVLPELRRNDDLHASAGYNYVTYGRNHTVATNIENSIRILPTGSTLSAAWSAHLGFTHDGFVTWSQNKLHDFRGVTQNYHPDPIEWWILAGLDGELLLWPESRWFAFGGHVSIGSYHQEHGFKAIFSDRDGQVRSHMEITSGWITTAGAGPFEVVESYGDSYFSVRARVDAGELFGLGIRYSTGLFPNEPEVMLSVHVASPIGTDYRFRVEHVNDLVGDKDRGYTGGLRIAVSRTR